MTPEQWQRAKEAFEDVAELPLDDARQKLRELCGGNTVIEATALELLSGDAPDVPSHAGDPHTFAVGSLITGRYRVLRYINRGGWAKCTRWRIRVSADALR